MSIEFALTTLVIVATPGTGVLFTLAAGLTRGTRASVIAAFVVFAGYGAVAAAMRTYVLSRPVVVRWTRRVFGVSFIAPAGRLAVQNR